MKFYVDENESPHFVESINRIYHPGQPAVFTPDDENLRGMKDIPLFETLQARGYTGLITRDRMQLRVVDPETSLSEADKLYTCGLHWIGHTEPAAEGVDLIAELAGIYLARWSMVLDLVSGLKVPSAIPVKRTPPFKLEAFPLAKRTHRRK